jgi:hypothetical protein
MRQIAVTPLWVTQLFARQSQWLEKISSHFEVLQSGEPHVVTPFSLSIFARPEKVRGRKRSSRLQSPRSVASVNTQAHAEAVAAVDSTSLSLACTRLLETSHGEEIG